MPTREDPYGEFDHLEIKPFDEAKADFKLTLRLWGDVNLKRHIASQRNKFLLEADKRAQRKFEEAHHVLIQAAQS